MKSQSTAGIVFLALVLSSSSLVSQVHSDSVRLAYLKAFAGMSNEFGFYSTLKIDYAPVFLRELGSRRLYFTASCETVMPPAEPDFQFTVIVYDSAVILKLVECEDMQSGNKLSAMAFKFPDSSTESLAKMIHWKTDSVRMSKVDKFTEKLVEDIWNLRSGIVHPNNRLVEGPSYHVFCSTSDGISYLQFSEGTEDCQGRALSAWITATHGVLKSYVRKHR
ncbi:MAG: hypothetical protein WBD36_03085 [Bacteroidota bacterium]